MKNMQKNIVENNKLIVEIDLYKFPEICDNAMYSIELTQWRHHFSSFIIKVFFRHCLHKILNHECMTKSLWNKHQGTNGWTI